MDDVVDTVDMVDIVNLVDMVDMVDTQSRGYRRKLKGEKSSQS